IQETYCARVSASGVVLDPSGIDVGASDRDPSIAAGVTESIITRDIPGIGLVVSFVDPDGAVSSPVVVSAGGTTVPAKVAFFGGNFDVVFYQQNRVLYSRVTPAHVLLDATPVPVDGKVIAAAPSAI